MGHAETGWDQQFINHQPEVPREPGNATTWADLGFFTILFHIDIIYSHIRHIDIHIFTCKCIYMRSYCVSMRRICEICELYTDTHI